MFFVQPNPFLNATITQVCCHRLLPNMQVEIRDSSSSQTHLVSSILVREAEIGAGGKGACAGEARHQEICLKLTGKRLLKASNWILTFEFHQ